MILDFHDFESGTLSGDGYTNIFIRGGGPPAFGGTIQTAIKRKGTYAWELIHNQEHSGTWPSTTADPSVSAILEYGTPTNFSGKWSSEGSEYYHGMSFRLPTDFVYPPGWGFIWEWLPKNFYIYEGTWSFNLVSGNLYLSITTGKGDVSPTGKVIRSTPGINPLLLNAPTLGVWHDFIVRIKWGTGGTSIATYPNVGSGRPTGVVGIIEVWHRREGGLTAFTKIYSNINIPTLHWGEGIVDNLGYNYSRMDLYVNFYRQNNGSPGTTTTMWRDCEIRGQTFADIEAYYGVSPTIQFINPVPKESSSSFGTVTVSVGQTGFPTTGLLDSFNRANEDPLANGNWSGPGQVGLGQVKLVSNQAAPSDVSDQSFSYWSAATFGPDSEAYGLIAIKPENGNAVALWCRIQTPGTSGLDGYNFVCDAATGTDTYRFFRADNAVYTQLGSTVTGPEYASGDSVGMEVRGTTFKGWRKSGGSWAEISNRTDSTYTTAGNIGLQFDRFAGGSAARVDDFSGGKISQTVETPVLGLGSSSNFGTPPTVIIIQAVLGIESAQTFGIISQAAIVTSVGSAQTFGSISVLMTKSVSGLNSGSSFGTVKVNTKTSVTGLNSSSSFGSIFGNFTIPVIGLSSQSSFGVIQTNIKFSVTGLPSASSLARITIPIDQVIRTPLVSTRKHAEEMWYATTSTSSGGSVSIEKTPSSGRDLVVLYISGSSDKSAIVTIENPVGTVIWEKKFNSAFEFSEKHTHHYRLAGTTKAKISDSTLFCELNLSGVETKA